MKNQDTTPGGFPSAAEDAQRAASEASLNASYRLAYTDQEFLLRDDLRAVRLQLEWLKPDLIQDECGINSTVVIFGGARFPEPGIAKANFQRAEQEYLASPEDKFLEKAYLRSKNIYQNSKYYDEARELAKQITERSLAHGGHDFVVVTGGGPGVMEAANRGAAEAGGKSIGLNIVLPFEQKPNPYITPELSFQFHYFALRKMHFLKRARALVACPGGYGTLDELFETLTLIQTRKIKSVPVVLIGKTYWTNLINFDFLAEQGAIDQDDIHLFKIVDSAAEAWAYLTAAWQLD